MGKQFEPTSAQNLVKHRSGAFYLNATVKGKKIRRKLQAPTLAAAKIERDALLRALRLADGDSPGKGAVTLSEAIERARQWYHRQELKPKSLEYRDDLLRLVKETCPNRPPAGWTERDAEDWWASKAVTEMSANRRNNLLGTVRKIFHLLKLPDVTHELKRVRVPKGNLRIPSQEEFRKVVIEIRSQKKAASNNVANMVEFLAYSGVRIAEAQGVTWGHVREDFIEVTGGEAGTKNHEERQVPILPAMRGLLATMKRESEETALFFVKTPRWALTNAAERLEIDHIRVHDLRHFFATTCIEVGVDIPTVAKWLGHKDGGALLLRTYSHLRDDHSPAHGATCCV